MKLQKGPVPPTSVLAAILLIAGCDGRKHNPEKNVKNDDVIVSAYENDEAIFPPEPGLELREPGSVDVSDHALHSIEGVSPILMAENMDDALEPLPEEEIEGEGRSTPPVNDIIGVGGGASKCYGKKLRVRIRRESKSAISHGGTQLANDGDYDLQFFKSYGANPMIDTDDDRFSTFAVDVDTASYTLCRKMIEDGNLPSHEAVRVEEFVNYFDYGYAPPENDTFAAYFEGGPSPFAENRKLISIGIKGMEIPEAERKDATLTFVIDISGSMDRENRLELVKKALFLLVNRLRPSDRIGIAVYGSRGRRLLDHTLLSEGKSEVVKAISALHPSGSTNAEEGLKIGYSMANENFDPSGINRVILCSDGVANVGKTGPDSILEVIRREVKRGICLTTVGFGMNNFNDVLMEQLGNKGNGHYAYVDTLKEAQRIFGAGLVGTLQVIARDVKIQVEFNPDRIRSYRLIGYENRKVADRDFRNEKVDAGEIGAGHSVTALYDVKPWKKDNGTGPLGWCRIRYKDPDNTGEVEEIEADILDRHIAASMEAATPHFRLASCVVQFAEILRKSYWAEALALASVVKQSEALAEMNAGNEKLWELNRLLAAVEKRSDTHEDSRRVFLNRASEK